ncbi:MAG: signal peptide peptidase SppA [Peptoniphilus sp.]|nr:signal peptide peptidase SppA [Peptoniphilus sp.]MDY3118510.1 signal peptide peptidase SppA [Peptoniphilus sp.]
MLEKMNTRRWIAVGVAVLILGISALSSGISSKLNRDRQIEKIETSLMNSVNGMNEEVVEEGDSTKRIAVITVEGTIMNTPQASFLAEAYDHTATLNALDDIVKDDTVKGVLLKVNSPGGGVYESAELYKRVKAIVDNHKPVYVTMGNTAASGGYYISAPATKIYAAPSTLTGSIGVIMGGSNLSGLMDKLGISDQTIKSAAHKDIGSTRRPMTDEERAILQGVVDDLYGEFLNVVSQGRHMDMAKLRPLADGSVFTGKQAKANGLVDELGYSEDALEALKKAIKTDNPEVFNYTKSLGSNFFSSLFSQKSTEHEVAAKLVLKALSDNARPMYLYGGE